MISKVTPLADAGGSHRGLWADGGSQYLNGPRIHEFLQEMRREVFDDRDGLFLTVGETPGCTVDDARLYTDPARGEVDMVFQFEHVKVDQGPGGKWDVQPLRLTDLKATLGRWQAGLADVGWNSLYLSNHDQPRPVSRFGDDGTYRTRSAMLLATVLHLHRGTPYVYQGEELGMANYPFAGIEDFQDIESLNHFAAAQAAGEDPEHTLAALRFMSRDNARTPMQWDATPQAGFTTGTPWIAVNPDYPDVNAAVELEDPDSVFHHYRRLIELRHTEPVVVDGSFTMLLAHHEQLYAYLRTLGEQQLLVIANMSGDEVEVTDLPDAAGWAASRLVLSNLGEAEQHRSWSLLPWEARVYLRRR
jgi:oligo-1,6-glucosidase